MKRITAVIVTMMVVLLVTGCSARTRIVSEPSAPQAIAAPSKRITESVIVQDIAYINELRQRLAALNAAGISFENYHFCKAQAWIDMAFDEYTDNDRSAVVAAALEQAQAIISGLETGASDISMETPVIATSKRMREDLWEFTSRVKQQSGFSCAACSLARLEVQLVWIGHEDNELGWRHAESEIMAAERLARSVQEDSQGCQYAASRQRPPQRVYFATDSSDINLNSAALLDQVAEWMAMNSDVRLWLEGHSDERGRDVYNQSLSLRRVRAVKEYLVVKGVSAENIEFSAWGELQPWVPEPGVDGWARNRRVEIKYGDSSRSPEATHELDFQSE